MISKNKQNTDSSSDSHNRIKISKFNKKVSSDGDSIDNSASFNINFIKQRAPLGKSKDPAVKPILKDPENKQKGPKNARFNENLNQTHSISNIKSSDVSRDFQYFQNQAKRKSLDESSSSNQAKRRSLDESSSSEGNNSEDSDLSFKAQQHSQKNKEKLKEIRNLVDSSESNISSCSSPFSPRQQALKNNPFNSSDEKVKNDDSFSVIEQRIMKLEEELNMNTKQVQNRPFPSVSGHCSKNDVGSTRNPSKLQDHYNQKSKDITSKQQEPSLRSQNSPSGQFESASMRRMDSHKHQDSSSGPQDNYSLKQQDLTSLRQSDHSLKQQENYLKMQENSLHRKAESSNSQKKSQKYKIDQLNHELIQEKVYESNPTQSVRSPKNPTDQLLLKQIEELKAQNEELKSQNKMLQQRFQLMEEGKQLEKLKHSTAEQSQPHLNSYFLNTKAQQNSIQPPGFNTEAQTAKFQSDRQERQETGQGLQKIKIQLEETNKIVDENSKLTWEKNLLYFFIYQTILDKASNESGTNSKNQQSQENQVHYFTSPIPLRKDHNNTK